MVTPRTVRRETADSPPHGEVEVWYEVDGTGVNTGWFWLNVETPDSPAVGIVMSRDELTELGVRIKRALTNA